MKELTTEEKLEAYGYALQGVLKDIINSLKAGICVDLQHWLNENKEMGLVAYTETLLYFPEFKLYQTVGVDANHNWWPDSKKGNQRRIEVLEEIIEKLKKSKK